MYKNVMTVYEYRFYSETEAYTKYLEANRLGKDLDMYTLNISCYISASNFVLTRNQFLLRIERSVFNKYLAITNYTEYLMASRKHFHSVLQNGLVITSFMKYSEEEFRQANSGKHPIPRIVRCKRLGCGDFIYNSNIIEDVNVTLDNTVSLLAGFNVSGISVVDKLCVLNYKRAFDLRKDYKIFPIRSYDLCKIHQSLTEGVCEDAGMLRNSEAKIMCASHGFPLPVNISRELLRLKSFNFRDNILYATKLHAELLRIRPFSKDNGRLCRLITYPYTNIPYELKLEYYSALDAYCSYGDLGPLYFLVSSLNKKRTVGCDSNL